MNYKFIYKLLITIFILWIFIHVLYTIIDGSIDRGEKADIAVVLGSKVNEDGTLSERLKKRLECGLNLYKSGRIKKIIVSGGLGKEGYYEGDKMKDFLLENGVASDLIIVDNIGNNTIATVNNTIKIKDSLKLESIIVVSQYFHLTRTKMLFRKKGFTNISSVSPNYFEFRDLYSLLREFVAYYVE